MMPYDLAAIVRQRTNPRRSSIPVRPIVPTQALASDLYARAYRPIIERVTATTPAILAAYERALTIRDGIRDAATDDTQSLLAALGAELQRLVLTLEPALRAWALGVEKWQRGKFRGAVLSATGVDLDTILLGSGTPQSVGEYINWNVALMKDVAAQAQARISSSVFAAFQARQPARTLAKQISEDVGFSRQRSLRIASDQLSKLAAALDQERQTEAGGKRFKWRHSRKKHPRVVHLERDGKTFAWDDPAIAGDLPGHAPFCGCRAQFVIEFD